MNKIPAFNSIEEMAKFWDTHDLTEFDAELEEVEEAVFERPDQVVLKIRLPRDEARQLKQLADSQGVEQAKLISDWVHERLKAG